MDRYSVAEARDQVVRFMDAVVDYEAALMESGRKIEITGCKQSAALRRASMDLTRALADMRRPR